MNGQCMQEQGMGRGNGIISNEETSLPYTWKSPIPCLLSSPLPPLSFLQRMYHLPCCTSKRLQYELHLQQSTAYCTILRLQYTLLLSSLEPTNRGSESTVKNPPVRASASRRIPSSGVSSINEHEANVRREGFVSKKSRCTTEIINEGRDTRRGERSFLAFSFRIQRLHSVRRRGLKKSLFVTQGRGERKEKMFSSFVVRFVFW